MHFFFLWGQGELPKQSQGGALLPGGLMVPCESLRIQFGFCSGVREHQGQLAGKGRRVQGSAWNFKLNR